MYVTLRDVHVLIGAHTGEHIDRSTLTSAYVKQLVRAPVGVVVIVARVARWCRVNDHLNTGNTYVYTTTLEAPYACDHVDYTLFALLIFAKKKLLLTSRIASSYSRPSPKFVSLKIRLTSVMAAA